MASITIETDDEGAIQDIENFLTSLYQRGVSIVHTSESPIHEVIATGKGIDFPDVKEKEKK